MFEKEAEEYVRKIRHDVIDWDGTKPEERFYNEIKFEQAYLAGAEFGYNKSKEELNQNGLALQSDMDKTIEQNIALKKELEKSNEWHYVKDGKDLPLEAGLHIRVVLHNGNEYICETDYYEPSEDEIGVGHLLIQLYSNDEWIDDNDVYAWCELSMPPKKE